MQENDLDPYVAESLKRVDEDLRRQRAIAILKIGVARMMSVQQILGSLPEDEREDLEQFVRSVPAEVIYDWLLSAIEDDEEDKRSSGPKPESVTFDLAMVRIIASGERGYSAGELQHEMGCTRGKIRLALERAKGQGWIRQEGDRGGACYYVTELGLWQIKRGES